MKNIIVGTAGHIDHGKTTLIKALTGRNTDRWEEEQRRGITIDLGFTYFDLKNGDRVGIIDVPGHEKFINNMVAGVVGMDLVLLVVAADEGIMPQTREHMDILGLLGIKKSILVINKCDLVDEEWLELVEEEIQEELEGTFLEGAPVVKVSAATGQGLDELTDTIQQLMSDEVVAKDTQTIPRLPIDRAFILSGFGTIITGTLISGTITREDVLEMYPIGKECKIRNIQVHGQNQDKCYAGQRVAINLSNVKKKEIRRGCVLAPKNSMKNTDLLDVKLTVLEDSMRILTNHERLHLYTGTSEILCRAVLLDKEQIGPGEEGLVQLRLEEEIAVKRGDRFVVRFYSPMETIGGGIVLEPNPVRKKRFDAQAIEELTAAGATFPVKILLKYNPRVSGWDSECLVIEQQLEALLGTDYIDVIVEAGPADGFLSEVRRSGNYALLKCNWGPDYADPQTFTDPFRKGNNYSFIDKSADTEALDYYYGLVEAAKAEAFDLTVSYETFAKAEAFLIDHAYVIPFGFGNGGYVASRIDPFTSQFAPYGFTNERYKGSEILSEPMDTDAYFDAYDQWIEDRASQTK